MADNLPEGAPSPASTSSAGPAKPPPLPPVLPSEKKDAPAKNVVMLSSVAKAPPEETPKDAPVASPPASSPAKPPPLPAAALRPPVLSEKLSSPAESVAKTGVLSPSNSPAGASTDAPLKAKVMPPPLPIRQPAPEASKSRQIDPIAKRPAPAPARSQKMEGKRPQPIVLNRPASTVAPTKDSIFLPGDAAEPPVEEHPAGWKQLEPGELLPPQEGMERIEVFSKSLPAPEADEDQPAPEFAPAAEVKSPEVKAPENQPPSPPSTPARITTLEPIVAAAPAAALQPAVVLSGPAPVSPPKLPMTAPAESDQAEDKATPPPLHHAPPLLEKKPASPGEKLQAPHLPSEERQGEPPVIFSSKSAVAPKLIDSKTRRVELPPPVGDAKGTGPIVPLTRPEETKPALRPPVLPNRLLAAREAEALTSAQPEEKTPEADSLLAAPSANPSPAPPLKPWEKAAPTGVSTNILPVTGPIRITEPAKFASTVRPSGKTEPKPPAIIPPVSAEAIPMVVPPDQETAPVIPAPVAVPVPIPVLTPTTTKTPEKTIAKPVPPVPPTEPVITPRAARARKRRLVAAVIFYTILAIAMPALYVGTLHFSRETRVEGQVIPPTGMKLGNEVWIVTDFRSYAAGIVEDLVGERTPKLHDIQDGVEHVHRAQADIAAREERIRLLQEQIQAAKDDIALAIKQARDAAQQVWDGPGAALEDEYNSRLAALQKSIADRAKSLNLKYAPDDSFRSPEVWANAYRLALYDIPANIDGAKEHQWLEAQIKQWRDFTKTLDDRQKQLREQAAQIQLAPTTKVTEVNGKIEDLQHRIDSTLAEEEPIKTELQQATADLTQVQTAEGALDDKYYGQLYALPSGSITKRLPVASNGRFSWRHVEKDSAFTEDEKTHQYYLLARAVRADGRQYWALAHLTLWENETLPVEIKPDDFISTKAILRPDLSPDEQAK